MKKLILSLSVLAMVACTGNGGKTEGDGNDSLNVEQQQNGAQAEEVPTDLLTVDLCGPVKYMVLTTRDCGRNGEPSSEPYQFDRFQFDEEGNMVKGFYWSEEGTEFPELVRNEQGQIESVLTYIADFDTNREDNYYYGEDGKVVSIEINGIESYSSKALLYTDGKLTGFTEDSASEGTVYKTNGEYKVLDVDDYGNWTKRIVKYTQEMGPDDGSDEMEEGSEEWYELQEREIEYYE